MVSVIQLVCKAAGWSVIQSVGQSVGRSVRQYYIIVQSVYSRLVCLSVNHPSIDMCIVQVISKVILKSVSYKYVSLM